MLMTSILTIQIWVWDVGGVGAASIHSIEC